MLNYVSMLNIWKRVCPGIEACVLRVRSTPDQSTFTDYALTHARPEPGAISDVNLAGNLVQDEKLPWLIWQDDLDAVSAPVPKVGDEVVQTTLDGSTVFWEITAVDDELFGQPYVCSSLRRAIVAAE